MVPARRLILSALLALAACTPRGVVTLAPGAAQVAPFQTVFVATSRGAEAERPELFGIGRSRDVSFGRFDVTIPVGNVPGRIAWPRGRPNPAEHFLTDRIDGYADASAFRSGLRDALAQRPVGQRDAVIFVHGFNTTFAEGLYRTAQIGADLDLPGVLVHYAWPSRASPLAYAYDRDSTLFARDGLERLLSETARAGAGRIVIVAHSVGSELAMEALRQLAIGGDRAVLRRIGGVVLVSPDLDLDLFRVQADRIGTLPQPFVIFTSQRDRALALSARLTGERQRLGNLSDPAPLADYDVTLLDVSAFSRGLGHFAPATSPDLLRILGRITDLDSALALERAGRTGLLPGAVLTVQSATQVILAPVAAIGGAAP